jgi:quinol monooxygenase YgiN
MYVMQATFKAKPGHAQALADKLAAAARSMASDERVKGWRVLIDHVADFWTVLFEASFEDLDDYFAVISRPGARAEMDGYLDLVEGGGRRLFRVSAEG